MAKSKRKPPIARWGWSGIVEKLVYVEEDDRALTDMRVKRLFRFLPRGTLSIEDFGARLRQIRVDYLCGLHQEEFGPSRADRAAALRTIISELDAVGPLLETLPPRSKELLAEELSASWPLAHRREDDALGSYLADKNAIEALVTAAASVRDDLAHVGKADEVDAVNDLWSRAAKACLLLSNLDSTTDTDVVFGARSADLELLESSADPLARLAAQIQRILSMLKRERARLRRIKGTEPRVSFDLLVARICDLWAEVTGESVTANPYESDEYKGSPKSCAGRFAVNVVRALRPSKLWVARYAEFTTQRRAALLTETPRCRAKAVHTAMRGYVNARNASAKPSSSRHTL